MLRYVEGSIKEKEMLLLSEHIENCDKCREEFAAYCEISSEVNKFELSENAEEIISDDFEFSVMKKISGVEFKTEKILICIIGMISLVMALLISIDVFENYMFGKEEFAKDIIENSKSVIDTTVIFIGAAIGTVFKFFYEFLLIMKPFSLGVVIFSVILKIIFSIKRGRKNV